MIAFETVTRVPEKVKLLSQRVHGLSKHKKKSFTQDVASTPYQIIGEKGRARLLYYASTRKTKHNLYIVPSLINQFYILDLYPGCSLIEELCDQGYDIYLLDWQKPRPQDQMASLEKHIFDWLDWGFVTSKAHSNNRKKWSMMGHCIGGTLTTVYQSIKKHRGLSLINLTTPIDFYDEGIFSLWSRYSSVDLALMARQWGEIHHDFLQYSFKLSTPMAEIKKWKHLWQNSHTESYLKRYACINHWIKDQMPFPGHAYKEFIEDFYQKNLLIKNELKIGDKNISLSNIKSPMLVLTAKGDTVVKHTSAIAVREYISAPVVHEEILGGHIGCLLSSKGRAGIVHQINLFTGEGYVQ